MIHEIRLWDSCEKRWIPIFHNEDKEESISKLNDLKSKSKGVYKIFKIPKKTYKRINY